MRVRTTVASGLLVLLGVAGCSGASGSGSGSSAGSVTGRVAIAAPAAAPSAAAAGGRADVSETSVRLSSGSKIRTADITVSVRGGKVPATADEANNIALRSGGEVDSDDRTSGASPSARLQLRVPPGQLTAVLSALSKLGHEDSRTLSTRDVTTQVADVDSRVISARAAIARLTALYARSAKVSDVIAIESELAQRQADLESLEAQQKALADQTALATVSVYLHTATAAAKHHTSPSGFLGGLSRGWHAFTHAAGAVAVAVGASVPFLGVLALALLLARLLWTRLGRRRTPIPIPSDDAIA